MSDILEQIRQERFKRIMKVGETFHESYLYCPYCAYEQEEIWEGFDLQPNGEEREGQCKGCERHFAYTVQLSFDTRRLK